MGLFGKGGRSEEPARGYWQDDLKLRFDKRWIEFSSSRFGDPLWTDRVIWNGKEYSDPLPPGWVASDFEGQQFRAGRALSRRWSGKPAAPVAEAQEYVTRKLDAMCAIFRPDIEAADRADLERQLAAAALMNAIIYLTDNFHAHSSYVDALPKKDEATLAQVVAQVWAYDPFFRTPPMMDEFLVVATQMELRNMGLLSPGQPVTHPY